MPLSGLRNPTKQELTNRRKISRKRYFSMRYKFNSRDSLLIVPIKYLPESARARAKARTSGMGCESENMKLRNSSRLKGGLREKTVRSRYSSSEILPRSN